MNQEAKASELRTKEQELRERVEALDREQRKVMAEETQRLSAASENYPGSFSVSGPAGESFFFNDEYAEVKRKIVKEARRSNSYQEILAEYTEAKTALDEVYHEIVSLAPAGATYEEKMRVFYETIRRDMRGIYEYIGCVPQYTHRFYWDDDKEQFCEKDWSKKRKEAQVTGPQRTRILKNYDYTCVKCGTQDEDEIVVHHIETVVNDDGTSEDENLAPLCKSCHHDVHGGAPSSGRVIYESVEQFWSWANGNKKWRANTAEQTNLDLFR